MEATRIIVLPKLGKLEIVITKVLITDVLETEGKKSFYSKWVLLDAPSANDFKKVSTLKNSDVVQMCLPKLNLSEIEAFWAKQSNLINNTEVEIKL
jgi:hypothetical protein